MQCNVSRGIRQGVVANGARRGKDLGERADHPLLPLFIFGQELHGRQIGPQVME